MKKMFNLLSLLSAIILIGCVEPSYRTEVTGNGQGGVDIRRVSKDADASQSPAPVPTESAQPPSAEPAQPAVSRPESTEDRLRKLEKQLQEKDAEIDRLKHQSSAPDNAAIETVIAFF